MDFPTRRRAATAIAILGAAVMLTAGCTAPPPPPSPASTPATPVPSHATVKSLIDARWMGVLADQPPGWEEVNRMMTADFQQFDFRPADDTEYMRGCNGCAPWTAVLNAYAPNAFDPTAARTGQPVSVNGTDDGYFRPADESEDATLTWQYAEGAWATASGLTSATRGLDQLLELAHALRPAERTPVRLPLSMANLPDDMPLAEIDIDPHTDMPAKIDYGTRIEFAPCGMTDTMATRDCMFAGETMSVHIAADDYRAPTGGVEQTTVPVKVGGLDGLHNETIDRVSVQVRPGVLVTFEVGGLDEQTVAGILANVTWASDPDDQATWPAVADWAK
ncbi:MAG: hypothetical protein QOD90_1324 [Mycobacterium sp.]|nr:hypothetical protein [Mycobacterium sp.]